MVANGCTSEQLEAKKKQNANVHSSVPIIVQSRFAQRMLYLRKHPPKEESIPGERRLLSFNAQEQHGSVFDSKDAKDIAKMRRG